jgi:uncharacterized protein Yka (UPF0111/DUF47 family)
MVDVLGGRALLLPGLVEEALVANAHVKYLFTLLQLARAHAEQPDLPLPDLSADRDLAGSGDRGLEAAVAESHRLDGKYFIPEVGRIVALALADVHRMLTPLQAAQGQGEPVGSLVRRFGDLQARCGSPASPDSVEAEALLAMTSAEPERSDSLHLLVVDAHKALNALQATLATEEIDGAKTYGLSSGDRELVAAFMRGLNRTQSLRFSHPGLGTTATRSGDRLFLQNDIGQTQAHVLMVQVTASRAVVTSTDVHPQRLQFFQQLFQGFPVVWSGMTARHARALEDVGLFYESVGTLRPRSRDELVHFLEHLGSRLVFLIDWNRARKALRSFVSKDASLRLLRWAAESACGHRGFLELGGDRLVYDAMAAVIRTPLRFGERLDDVLGPAGAEELLRFALDRSAKGLLDRRPAELIREQVHAYLWSLFDRAGERLLGPLAEHAVIVVELAYAVLAQIRALGRPSHSASRSLLVQAAKDLERSADDRVRELCALMGRIARAADFQAVLSTADDAVDALEETVFVLTLLREPGSETERLRQELEGLGKLLVAACRAYLDCVRAARHLRRRAAGEELQPFLVVVDRVISLEREVDAAERAARLWLAHAPSVDGKLFAVTSRVIDGLEQAADALTHATVDLRDCLMTESG